MTYNVFIGVDPGASGGIAVILGAHVEDQTVEVQAIGNLTIHQLWQQFDALGQTDCVAVLEQVGGFIPKTSAGYEGGSYARGSHMFTFGSWYGRLQMALTGAGIPYQQIVPRVWQRALGMKRDKGETDSKWKGRLKAKALELYPRVKVTLATADALLMAEYCRRKHLGELA